MLETIGSIISFVFLAIIIIWALGSLFVMNKH